MTLTQWWEPNKPDRTLPGLLSKDDTDGWLLQLDGTFIDPPVQDLGDGKKLIRIFEGLPEDISLVVGVTANGKLVSLMNCRPVSSSPPFAGSRGSLKLWPRTLVHGVHLEDANDFKLTSLSVRYSHLDSWVSTRGFEIEFSTNGYPVTIRYSPPDAIEACLSDDLAVKVEFSSTGPNLSASTNIQISQNSWLTLTSKQGLTYDQMVTHLHSFSNLVSLFIGLPMTPLAMEGRCWARTPSEDEVEEDITIIDNRKPLAEESGADIQPWQILFTLPAIRPRLQDVMKRWFERGESLQSLYDLYFGSLHAPARYVEHRFVNLFQALESFDRRTFREDPEKVRARAERQERILSSLESKDRKWLEKKLPWIVGPSAGERIQRLVDNLDAGWLLTKDQVSLAVRLRNYYTHFDPEAEKHLPDVKVRFRIMHNLTVLLRVLCELILLDALGFGAEEVRERMKATRRIDRHSVSETI